MDTKLQRLNEIFSRAFEENIIVNFQTSKENELLWDSINHLNLIVELEDKLNVFFSSEEIEYLDSVEKLTNLLEKKGVVL
jgi:acyl carrier protein